MQDASGQEWIDYFELAVLAFNPLTSLEIFRVKRRAVGQQPAGSDEGVMPSHLTTLGKLAGGAMRLSMSSPSFRSSASTTIADRRIARLLPT